MLLLIDAGNTRIKWALAAPGAAPGAFELAGACAHADAGALAAQWAPCAARVTRIVLANVAGPAVRGALDGPLSAWPHLPPEPFVAVSALAGVRNAYREPSRLGADRFAAAIGAHALFPGQAVLVVNCGTATTADALGPDGTFAGGMILPGLRLMAHALYAGTAQLPEIDWDRAPAGGTVGDNTEDAIAAGCLAAQCGAIERALAAHRALHGTALCVLSGGAAPAVRRALGMPVQIVDNLVLTGLHAASGARP